MDFLQRRGKVYSCVFPVPVDLQATIGKKQIWRSLHTRCYDTARSACRRMAADFDKLFLMARWGMITQQQINMIIAEYGLQNLSIWEYYASVPKGEGTEINPIERAAHFEAVVENLELKLANEDYDDLDKKNAKEALKRHKLRVSADSYEFTQLVRGIAKAEIDYNRIVSERIKGRYGTPQQEGIIAKWKADYPKDKGMLLSVFLNKYADDWAKTAKHSAREKRKYSDVNTVLKEVKACFRRELHIFEVDSDTNDKLVNYWAKKKKHTPSTINKKIELLSAAYNWGIKNKIVKENPIKGMRQSDPNKREKRVKFTQPELQLYIDKLAELYDSKHPELTWLPLICLYTGMRPGEVAQMYCDDVVVVEGYPCLRIIESKERKQTHKEGARRTIPVHPVLKELGFLRYVTTVRGERLFPNCKFAVSDYTYYSSELCSALNATIHAHVTPKKTMYNLRHTFKTAAERGIARMGMSSSGESVVAFAVKGLVDIMGHAHKGTHDGVYGEAQAEVMYWIMTKTSHDVDYSKLMASLAI